MANPASFQVANAPLAKKYNISDNGYRKYLKRHNLPITREERKAYRDNLEK